jgi:hypothetical protein
VTISAVQTSAINSDPELLRLAEGASMDVYEPLTGGSKMKVTIDLKDGRTLEAEEDFMILKRYPTKQELLDKFWNQFEAFGRLPRKNGEKIIALASRIDEVEDMREFTEALYVK